MRREEKFSERRLDVLGIHKIDLRRPIAVGLKIDDIAMSGLGMAMPFRRHEIIALAVMAADRAGIGVRIEAEDVALHGLSKTSGGLFTVGLEPSVDLFDRRIDDLMVHPKLRAQ